jgi:hypothetical protein
MLRVDSGPGEAPGDFRCLVPGCGWAKQGIWRQSARKHMQRRHPGVPFAAPRTREAEEARRSRLPRRECLPNEERRERNKASCKRYRQEIKVRQHTLAYC